MSGRPILSPRFGSNVVPFPQPPPWLVESDRSLLEIAAELRGKLRADPVAGVNLLQVYSAVLSKLGATPADRSRITMPNDDYERDEFFDPPARSH